MYSKRLFTSLNTQITYTSIIAANLLLAACENLSVGNQKPVFTVVDIPSVVQGEKTQVKDVQPEIQTEETGLSEVKQSALMLESTKPETIVRRDLSEEINQASTKINNSEATEKTKITDASQEAYSVPEGISEESDDKSQHKAEQNAGLIVTELERESKTPILAEPLTSTEIASLITTPPSIYAPPPLERIRIRTLLKTDSRALKSVMGVPDFVLRSRQMLLWQYDVGECIIDFFLKQSQYDYIVTFVELRAKMLGDTVNDQACESELTQSLNS